MPGKIFLFVRNEEVSTGEAFLGRPVSDGLQTHYCTMRETVKTEKVMSEADKRVLEIVNEIAKEKDVAVEVCDVTSFKGRIKASLSDIKRTPAIVIGKQKLEGALTREQIVEAINAEISR
jgi:hypothetical protein